LHALHYLHYLQRMTCTILHYLAAHLTNQTYHISVMEHTKFNRVTLRCRGSADFRLHRSWRSHVVQGEARSLGSKQNRFLIRFILYAPRTRRGPPHHPRQVREGGGGVHFFFFGVRDPLKPIKERSYVPRRSPSAAACPRIH